MAYSTKKQLYWKRMGQLELLEKIIELLEASDKQVVLEALKRIHAEVEAEARFLRSSMDPVLRILDEIMLGVRKRSPLKAS